MEFWNLKKRIIWLGDVKHSRLLLMRVKIVIQAAKELFVTRICQLQIILNLNLEHQEWKNVILVLLMNFLV